MIYFIECCGRIKVGFSKDPWKRLSKVSSDAPFPCKLIGVMTGDRDTEARVHVKWGHLHCHREWFAASTEFVSWIAEWMAENYAEQQPAPKKVHGDLCGLPIERGSKIRIAKECGVTPGAVTQWHKVPAEYCAIVSRITGHDLHILRPDIFANVSGSVQ